MKNKNNFRWLIILTLLISLLASAQDLVFKNGFENRRPSFTSEPSITSAVDQTYIYDVDATDPDGDALTFSLSDAPSGMTIDPVSGEIGWTPVTSGKFSVTVIVSDGKGGTASQSWEITVNPGAPPDPKPSLIDPTVLPSFPDIYRFLYVGPDATQKDVQEDALMNHALGIVRGEVMSRSGVPLSGVKVTVLQNEELGYTLTRSDGRFDLAVNGGGKVFVNFELDGYLSAQRHPNVTWNEITNLETVRLVPLSPTVTTIALSPSEAPAARGDVETDADGSRQGALIFQPGTSAFLRMPDGSTQAIDTLDVRITEFTVGENGPQAMPAELPPTSGYTYAAEFSVDQAQALGAVSVHFDPPALSYTENFVGFSVGTSVPTASYDRQVGAWQASSDGVVLKIVGTSGSLAEIDLDGDDIADDAAAFGMSDAERQQLATLYSTGQELWRVEVPHFTPWDHNWPFTWPDGAGAPAPDHGPRTDGPKPEDDCEESGFSRVNCLSQVLLQDIPLAGTTQSLHYRSDRSESYIAGRTVDVLIPADEIPDVANQVRIKFEVAGRTETRSFGTFQDIETRFVWDGLDAYDRKMYGPHPFKMVVSFVYPAAYSSGSGGGGGSGGGNGGGGSTFFSQPGVTIEGDRTALEISISRSYRGILSAPLGLLSDLGGWTLSDHHAFSTAGNTLFLGNGTVRPDADGITDRVIRSWECDMEPCRFDPQEGRHVKSRNLDPNSAAPMADGSVLYMNLGIWRVKPDGLLTKVASGKGSLLTVMPDQRFLFHDNGVVHRMSLDGTSEPVFGGGGLAYETNLDFVGSATELFLDYPDYSVGALAAGPDGSFYAAVTSSSGFESDTVWRVSPDGTAQRIGGNGLDTGNLDDGDALTAELFIRGMTVTPDSDVWLADYSNNQVRKISGGQVQMAIGTGLCTNNDWEAEGPIGSTNLCRPQLLASSPSGIIYVYSYFDAGSRDHRRIFQVDGESIRLIAGGASLGIGSLDGEIALGGRLGSASAASLHVHPNGSVMLQAIGGRYETLFIESLYSDLESDQKLYIPSRDGRLLYEFDSTGRHLRSMDTFLKQNLRIFDYDSEGRLIGIMDELGRSTTIQRIGSGIATSITGPDGRTTQLAITNGLLTAINGPAGDSHSFSYGTGGEMTGHTDPRSNSSSYDYDETGRLIQATNRAGGALTLERTQLGIGEYEVEITTRGTDTRIQRLQVDGTALVRTLVDPTGATTVVRQGADGLTETTFPDGTTAHYRETADTRFGPMATYVSEVRFRTPDGVNSTTTLSNTLDLADPADPMSVARWTSIMKRDGRTTTHLFDAVTRTLTRTTPEGRVKTETWDETGRVLSLAPGGGLDALAFSYDAAGRVKSVTHGPETLTLEYDADGDLVLTTDQDGGETNWTHDNAGRIESVTLPGDRFYEFTLDNNGNRTEVIMPEGQTHALTWDENNRMSSYTVPGSGALELDIDGLGRRNGVTYPDGSSRVDSFANEMPVGSTLPEAVLAIGYAPEADPGAGTTRLVEHLSRNPDGRPEQALDLGLDGRLVESLSMSGPATASVTYDYIRPYRLIERIHGSEPAIAFTYDNDELLTGAGPFTLTREAATGLLNSISDGTLTIGIDLDSRIQLVGRDMFHGTTLVHDLSLTRNARNRVVNRTEIIDGLAIERSFEYDADGQLVSVNDGGDELVESFTWDRNGNRTSHTTSIGTANASYNDQDQLTMLDGVAYGYDGNGFLMTRGIDSFDYGVDGVLRTANVNGFLVTYDHDFYGRRVARSDSNGITTYVYGDLGHPFRITASIAPDDTVTEYFYDDSGVLFAFRRGGAWFYVGADQVGSPTVVVEASSGNVVKTISYSAFGEVLSDSAQAFILPIGFAGGLADPMTDLIRFGLRDYEPGAGRFTARDPLLLAGGSANLYAYVGNEPIDHRDITGLFLKIGGSAYSGLGGGVSVTVTTGGVGFCAEGGIGVGGGLGFEPFAGLPEAGFSAVGAVGVGPVGTGLELPFNDCLASGSPQFKWDGLALAFEGVNNYVDPHIGDIFSQAAKESDGLLERAGERFGKNLKGLKAEASLSVRGCLPPITW